jgi:hypothetical protein
MLEAAKRPERRSKTQTCLAWIRAMPSIEGNDKSLDGEISASKGEKGGANSKRQNVHIKRVIDNLSEEDQVPKAGIIDYPWIFVVKLQWNLVPGQLLLSEKVFKSLASIQWFGGGSLPFDGGSR